MSADKYNFLQCQIMAKTGFFSVLGHFAGFRQQLYLLRTIRYFFGSGIVRIVASPRFCL